MCNNKYINAVHIHHCKYIVRNVAMTYYVGCVILSLCNILEALAAPQQNSELYSRHQIMKCTVF